MKWLTLSLILIDWGQTNYIAENPDAFQEGNSILGRNPSQTTVNTYFTAVSLAHLHLYDNWKWYRDTGVYIVVGVEGQAITSNWSIGIQARF